MILRKILYIISLLSLSLIIPLDTFADIYQWVDDAGVIHFTNIPSENKFKRIIKEDTGRRSKINKRYIGSYISASSVPNQTEDYSDYIHTVSEKYQIDPALVKAIIKAESNFRANAVSKKGAKGLMQLMPQTANELNVKNSFNPEENIEGGVRYLKYLLEIFGGDLSLSLAAYNAGPELVRRLGKVPSIKETKDYVRRVLSLYNGTGLIGLSRDTIYKIVFDDGTTIFTNIPYNYSNQKYLKRM